MELLERYICAELESVLLGERPERLDLLRRVYEREGATDLQEVQCYREVRMLGVRETEAHSALLEALRFGVDGVTIILAVVVGVSIPNIFIQKRMETQQQREIDAILARRAAEE